MALMKCPSCGREVSAAAAACPHCGHPLAAKPAGGINTKDPIHVIGIIVAIVILVVFVGGLILTLINR